MFTSFLTGLGTGAGLIIAIGSQNAFVLTQGIKKQHHLTVALICALCDTILIGAGIAGMGTLIEHSPRLITIASVGGSVFLFFYGMKSLIAVIRNSEGLVQQGNPGLKNRKQAVLTTLALTLLNPHVYLDTVVLLGGISGTFPGSGRYLFGAGAMVMSYLWFFALTLGAGLAAPLFRKAFTWRILNTVIGIVMWSISYKLFLFSGVQEYLKQLL